MGEVWLAGQAEPVNRRVALKVIKQGMDTKQVVARFEAERQALAMMDHPAVAKVFDELAELTGRRYHLVDYEGAPDAERVVVMMGSGAGAVGETVAALNAAGEKVGLATIRLYRPFPTADLLAALPETVKSVAVLDRTKEPGALGEPLFQDVITAMAEAGRGHVEVIGGRYGLGSKEFDPPMAKAVFDELTAPDPKRRFTVGIVGMSEVEGKALLDKLFEHSVKPEHVYRHRWRAGDLVMWDNRCTMHRATDYDLRHVRAMHRTTIQGDRPV